MSRLKRYNNDPEVLIQTLMRQSLLAGQDALAKSIASVCKLEEFAPGTDVITQGDEDNDLYFILGGSVDVVRSGRSGPTRSSGEYFGELTLLDPGSVRSATIRALEPSIVAKVKERDIRSIGAQFPELWRRLAQEVASRLRQRLDEVPPKNDVPFVFIGSSAEGLPIAQALQAKFEHYGAEVRVWTDGIFRPSNFPIEDLEETLQRADFGVLLLSPDDKTLSRGETKESPRDNVVFELGLFVGAIGRKRTFLLQARGSKVKIPSDLIGVTPIEFDEERPLEVALASGANQIKSVMTELGPK